MTTISEITKLLISNFNKSFDIRDTEEKLIYQDNELKYLELIIGIKTGTIEQKLEEQQKKNKEERDKICNTKFEFPPAGDIKTINDVNFIDDIVFALKVIEYRKLELEKKIAIIKYNLVVFNYLVINLLSITKNNATPEDVRILKQDKDRVKIILEFWLENNNPDILIQYLYKYNCLAKNILEFQEKNKS